MKKLTVFVSILGAVLSAAVPASADVVTDWNTQALNAIRAAKTPPPVASRQLAILHLSIYDAVNGITRTHEPYRIRGTVARSASTEAAAAAAAHRVMVSLYAANAAAYDAAYQTTLNALGNSPDVWKGIAWGDQVAQNILAWRATDGFNAAVTPPAALVTGDWVPTPPALAAFLLPQWGHVTPFAMSSSTQFRPHGPPALNSEKYALALNEVKVYGAATNSLRTADQSQIALFWADGGGTETPPGHWNSIAQDVGTALGNTMEQNARLFALLNMAMADAAKYSFHNWRPVTAIRNADLDDNPATEKDPNWSSYIGTPPFPDYVSGHSTFSAAASTVLAMFYGTDNIPFTTGSDFLPGVHRSFASFSAAAAEAAISRLYGGIHFRFANEDGLTGGLSIGEWTFTHYLQPSPNRSRN